ncbi:hypothetical protein DEO72_LG3g1787 [Vigna unguiculata]|uniref:Thionin-like protein 2 n=1 Tax=Vigna unguiculata TaxID=3917 RepID=A0A4D6LFK1_VIGUN|nr:hypothetical protein DEO72_LG3g1787 [Vigna unguiculata]
MGKFEIKIIGVIMTVMILTSFSEANFWCNVKCKIKCEEQPFPEVYDKCMRDCKSSCSKLSSHPVYNCITGCHLMKSIATKNGVNDLVDNVMNSCIQECKERL